MSAKSARFEVPSENEFQMGIQFIVKAYEKKSSFAVEQAQKLEEFIKVKDNKIAQLEENVRNLNNEFIFLKDENEKIVEENRKLKNVILKFNQDNSKLINFKNNIISSLDLDLDLDLESNFNNMNLNKAQVKDFLKSRNAYDKNNFNNFGNFNNLSNSGKPPIFDNYNTYTYQNPNHFSINNFSHDSAVKFDNTGNLIKTNPNQIHDAANQNIDAIYDKLNAKFNAGMTREKTNETKSNDSITLNDSTNFSKFDQRIKNMKAKLKNNTHNNNTTDNKDLTLSKSSVSRNSHQNQYNSPSSECLGANKKYTGKSNQYIMASKFFNECKIALQKDLYEELIEILNNRKENFISDEEVYHKVESILINHPRLFKDFQAIFPSSM